MVIIKLIILHYEKVKQKLERRCKTFVIQEDKMLAKTLLENNGTRKLRWQEVAQIMHSSIEGCQKTGKQCRER